MNDLIEWKLVAKDENNTNIYSYFNVNQVETKGLEFNSTYTKLIIGKLNLATNYFTHMILK